MHWYCFLVFAYFLWAEPYVGESVTIGGRSLSAIVMITWWAMAGLLAVRIASRRERRLPLYWIAGWGICAVLAAKCVLLSEDSHAIYIVSQSVGFLTMGLIIDHWKPTPRLYSRWSTAVSLGMLAFVVFANCVALGLYVPAGLGDLDGLTVGDARFTSISDGAVCTVAVIWAASVCLTARRRWEQIIGAATILLAFSRLVSYGAKGLMACAVFVAIATLMFNLRGSRMHKRLVSLAGLGSLGVCLVVFLAGASGHSVDTLQRYWESFQARFESNETLHARFDEAGNDWDAFQDRPLLGWGAEVPGYNFLGEPSYGHFFVTGTLARFGLLGSLGLAVAYLAYLWAAWQRVRRSADRRARSIYLGFLAWLPFFLILGNPLYLFSAWSVMPFLFVTPRAPNRHLRCQPNHGSSRC